MCPQAAYLQRLGVNTAVFERRHVIGGAAVTEEIIPGEPPEVVWGGWQEARPWPLVTVFIWFGFRVQVLPSILPPQPAEATDLHGPGAEGRAPPCSLSGPGVRGAAVSPFWGEGSLPGAHGDPCT